MKVSLIITTYNWKEALRLCLHSLMRQTIMPTEVIIADDGSLPDTKQLIDDFRDLLPCPVIHIWHEDNGWRKCEILNKAIEICHEDYIIEIDGDIIMHSRFIEDHLSESESGYYLAGSRGKINKKLSGRILQSGDYKISLLTNGIKRKLCITRFPLLTPFFYNYKSERGCNISFWRKDILNINGYDECIKGYGYEDTDMFMRLRRSGVKKKFIKFKAIEYHIYHDSHPSKKDMVINKKIFESNNMNNVIRCSAGVDQYTNKHILPVEERIIEN